jgi:hypothetical protein
MRRLSIGDLARATGLTVRALRHYQDLGLLAPAAVDGVLPAHWDGGGDDRYERGLDTSVTHSPGASGRIAFRGGDPGEDNWATFAQTATPVPFRGGRVRYRGWLRTREVRSGWAGLWLRVEGSDREVLAFDNLGQVPPDRSLRGTTGWTRAEIVLPVAAEAVTLAFGVVLAGDGVLWADDLELEALAG